jgi:hypothetical protein
MTSPFNAFMPQQFDPLGVDKQIETTNALAKENRLADLVYGEKQRAIEQGKTENALYQAAVGPDGSLDQNKLFSGYAQSGLGSKLPDLQKKLLDANKVSTDLKKTQGEISAQDFTLKQNKHKVAVQNLASLLADPELSYDKAVANIQAGIQDGHLDPKAAAGQLQALPQDPTALRLHLQKGLMSVLSADQQLQALAPKTDFKDAGGQIVGLQMNPSLPGYGKPIEGAAIQKTQSPDNVATIANQREMHSTPSGSALLTSQQGKIPPGYRVSADGARLEAIPGGPADTGKALPGPAVKDLGAAGASVENTTRLTGSFKPEYGGHYILGDMANKLGRVFGDESGQAQWWQDMDALQNQTRHDLFGSALTKTELGAWEKTSITPSMDAKQVQQNLQRRQEIEARAASKLARAYVAAGYNKEQINELLGSAAQYINNPAPPASPVKAGSKAPMTSASTSRKVIAGKTYENDGKGWYEVK